MSLIKVNKNENPYDVIGNYIEKHISVIDNVIAVISINGEIHNELFLIENSFTNSFIWEMDWWEGEENVELIDFFFVGDACKRCNNNDLISRQAAIAAIEFDITYVKAVNKETGEVTVMFEKENKALEDAVTRIKQLPPAQPEIIRCKDCKHWIPYDWMFSEVWQSKNIADYPEDEIGCNYCDMTMKANDFCSRGERRNDG